MTDKTAGMITVAVFIEPNRCARSAGKNIVRRAGRDKADQPRGVVVSARTGDGHRARCIDIDKTRTGNVRKRRGSVTRAGNT